MADLPYHTIQVAPQLNYLNPWTKNSSFEANSCSAAQILRLLWNSKFSYRVLVVQPLFRVPSQFTSDHILISCLFKIHFNIILPPTPRPLKWYRPVGFVTRILYLYCFVFRSRIIFEEYKLLGFSLCVFLWPAITF